MNRHDNTNLKPDFDAFDDLGELQASPLLRSAAQRGGVVALACVAEWKLIDLARESLQIAELSEATRLTICVTLAVLMVVVFGLAAWFIGSTVKNAPSQTAKKRSTQPRHQSRDP